MNGRPASEASTPSSSSDFYGVNASAVARDDQHDGDDEGSSSEMDVSEFSRSPTPDTRTDSTHAGAAKRGFADVDDVVGSAMPEVAEDVAKRRKLQARADTRATGARDLGPELWQYIFTYLPPAMLCRCLQVCKRFNHYLTKIKAATIKKSQRKVELVDSEVIWSQARKIYFPNLPKPLAHHTELDMLRLMGSKTCQFCLKTPFASPATTPFNCGPGPDGVRVVWPFGVRACGHCLTEHTLKDVQILVSPAATLRVGLPYIFLTPDLHFVPEGQRQLPGGIPSQLRVAKVYFKRDVTSIVQEWEDAKDFGNGAADEWRKGLPTKGKEAMMDAARWEKWEGHLRLGSDLSQALREYDLSSFPKRGLGAQSRSAGMNGPHATPVVQAVSNKAVVTHPLPQPVHSFTEPYRPPMPAGEPSLQHFPRPPRNAEDIERARQARRADIEQRCKTLEPPLDPNVLQHMETFQAALQITTPLTEPAWQVLKPRIMAQREAAELAEHQRQEQLAALQASLPPTATDEAYLKSAKELYDKDYDKAQEPLRKRLAEYATININDQIQGGLVLDKDTVPAFTVQTMLNIQQRYLHDKRSGSLPASTKPKKNTSNSEPFLSLDNMKWVYDNSIRPLTDNHRRELFICVGCADERKPKWFAFEGLLQHYGAKHTTAFSKGNVIVHWQTSEWPDPPPFHTNPSLWIKSKSERKDYARPRNAAMNVQEAASASVGPGMLLSDHSLFSSLISPPPLSQSTYTKPAAYSTFADEARDQQTVFGPYPEATVSQASIDISEHAQVTKLACDAREMWDGLEGIKDLLECIRIHAIFHHAVSRFVVRFKHKPSLDVVTDALATNALVRPIKNANGLVCKVCVASLTKGLTVKSYYTRVEHAKSYNISSLISHFKIMHQAQEHAGGLDWTEDMMELPEPELVSDLLTTPGMDDDKLAIVAAAFPNAFPTPLPHIGLVQERPPDLGPDSGLARRLVSRLGKKQQKSKKKGAHSGHGIDRDGSQGPMPEPKEDEYDPRRPMYLQAQDAEADLARFDTDVARKASASMAFSLAPETLAALNDLNALTVRGRDSAVDDRGDRSPSVGRESNSRVESQPPDIAAILASLAGPTVPAASANQALSVASRSHGDLQGQYQSMVSPEGFQDGRRSSARYSSQANQRPSMEPAAAYHTHELEVALARNARHVEHKYSQPSQSYSPLQYRHVYADRPIYAHSTQPEQPSLFHSSSAVHAHYTETPTQQLAPAYHNPSSQYIQPPPHTTSPYAQNTPPPTQQQSTYPHQLHQPQRTIYVDEYGRPLQLVPVESGYSYPPSLPPSSYDQQQQYVHHATTLAPQQVYDGPSGPYYGQSAPPWRYG